MPLATSQEDGLRHLWTVSGERGGDWDRKPITEAFCEGEAHGGTDSRERALMPVNACAPSVWVFLNQNRICVKCRAAFCERVGVDPGHVTALAKGASLSDVGGRGGQDEDTMRLAPESELPNDVTDLMPHLFGEEEDG